MGLLEGVREGLYWEGSYGKGGWEEGLGGERGGSL